METARVAEPAAWKKNSIVILTDWKNLPQVREDVENHNYELFQVSGIAVIDVNENKTLPEKLGTSHLWQRRICYGLLVPCMGG